MAIPSLNPRQLTGDMLVDAALHGYYWDNTSDGTIYWSVSNGFYGETWLNPDAIINTLSSALATFSTFANCGFTYVGFYQTPYAAAQGGSNINVSLDGTNTFIPGDNWAIGHFPSTTEDTLYQGQAGDIYININSKGNFLPSYDPGSEGFFLLLHELGHTIGLKHPHDDGGTGRPTLGDIGLEKYDKDRFSIMSYQDDYPLDQISFDPATPMLLDVIGLQALYGKNMSTNAGDNTHVLDTSNLYYTIWDAGGVDIMDMSSANEGWYVELPDTLASVLVGEKIGRGLPLAEIDLVSPSSFVWLEGDIEHATGSNFSDIIVGNSLANVLDGGAGADTAIFGRNYHEYSLATFYGTTYITGGTDGADSLTGIETLEFFDWIVSPPENRSPLEYVAGYADLIAVIGSNPDAALGHYLGYGRYEGRDVAFDALEYVASHGDLVRALGANRDFGAAHYINYGYYEGRAADAFNAAQYLTNYADLQGAFGSDLDAATMHYIEYGFEEGRTDDVLMV